MSASKVLKEFCWSGLREQPEVMEALSEAISALEQKEKLLDHANGMIRILQRDLEIAKAQNDGNLESEAILHHTKLLLYAWEYVKDTLESKEMVGEQK